MLHNIQMVHPDIFSMFALPYFFSPVSFSKDCACVMYSLTRNVLKLLAYTFR